jgi:hypothetical protein
MEGSDGSIVLIGNRGFTLFSPGVNTIGGAFLPFDQCPCAPGSTVSLFAAWSGSDLQGGATLDGQSYSLGIGHTDAEALVEFTGSVVMPPLVGDSSFVSAPFLFSGIFNYPDFVLPSEALTGRGTATLTLRQSENTPGHWAYISARYEFEPVPEPGTILLVGGGLAALAARARKRTRVTEGNRSARR